MRYIYSITIIICTLLFFSCRDDFSFEPSVGELRFSKDTVYLDTVFKNIGSSTYNLKVYNKSNKNIKIPKIKLGQGQNSKFRLMVDGVPGKEFDNVELLAKDSMYVFVEVTADIASANPTTMLYTDEIQFGSGNNFQKVDLVTLIKDAIFIFPERSSDGKIELINLGIDPETNKPINTFGANLSSNDPVNGNELKWTKSKPYVIYGYAKVPDNMILEVDPGARVHFHSNSGLIVGNGASLKVNGDFSTTKELENEVIFEGDRLEYDFSEVPGQWGTIWFLPGSVNNTLKNMTIKNAIAGVLTTGNDGSGNPNVVFENVQIYNCTNVGILARNANLSGKNMVINNCGEASLGITFGGTYDFTHCTFANYWNRPNQTVTVLNSEVIKNDNFPLNQANFKNCIFYGNTNSSIIIDKKTTVFNYNFTNCLIKFIDPNGQFANNPLYAFNDVTKFTNCKIADSNQANTPNFTDTSKNNFKIKDGSSCINSAMNLTPNFNDILNKVRPTTPNPNPDIGAYQYVK